MNRRRFLASIPAIGIAATANADCRDENGMIMPGEGSGLLELSIRNQSISHPERQIARALFGFGAYEDLLKHQKEKTKHNFLLDGRKVKITVTHLSVDVNRRIGCVVCEVHGRLWQ